MLLLLVRVLPPVQNGFATNRTRPKIRIDHVREARVSVGGETYSRNLLRVADEARVVWRLDTWRAFREMSRSMITFRKNNMTSRLDKLRFTTLKL